MKFDKVYAMHFSIYIPLEINNHAYDYSRKQMEARAEVLMIRPKEMGVAKCILHSS